MIWSKPLAAYGDKSKETFFKDERNGGHFVFERDSEQAKLAGKPIRRFIETVQDQRDYCRAEGLMMPSDIPGNLSVGADGSSYETANKAEV